VKVVGEGELDFEDYDLTFDDNWNVEDDQTLEGPETSLLSALEAEDAG
jgi:hypothetical protein